jgi:glycosyltransferase 2 family protein
LNRISARAGVTVFAGLAVAVAASYFALKDINVEKLGAALATAQYGYVIPALLVVYMGYAARAWRWQLMIAPLKQIPFRKIFPLLVIGFAWNVLIPLRVGEIVRAHLLGQRENVSRPALLATVIVERVLDGVAIMALLALVGILDPGLPGWVEDFTRIALLLFGVALAGLVMLIVSERFTLRLIERLTTFVPHVLAARINRFAQSFVQGYVALRSPSQLFWIAVATVVGWLIEIGSYAILFPAFGLNLAPPAFISATSFYAVVLNLATLVPSPPGFVATIEGFGVAALDVFHINRESALSLTVVGHAIQLVVIITLGLWALWHEHLTPSEVAQRASDT